MKGSVAAFTPTPRPLSLFPYLQPFFRNCPTAHCGGASEAVCNISPRVCLLSSTLHSFSPLCRLYPSVSTLFIHLEICADFQQPGRNPQYRARSGNGALELMAIFLKCAKPSSCRKIYYYSLLRNVSLERLTTFLMEYRTKRHRSLIWQNLPS